MIMISLIGEQPIPNLLPIRYQPPEVAVLVHSNLTQKPADRLRRLLPPSCKVRPLPVSAYDIESTRRDLVSLIRDEGWAPADLLFNLTGGTKAMALAAYLAAAEHGADFLYLQSEGKQTRLYRYRFSVDGAPHIADDRLLPGLITIDDYLRAFVDSYHATGVHQGQEGGRFEEALFEALQPPCVDEILSGVKLLGALDVDFVVRCDNQVAIIEAKTGGGVKKGIDQVSAASEQRYLGTYTAKMLVSDQRWDHTLNNLRELADARRIQIIELPSFGASGALSDEDRDRLVGAVCGSLGRSSPIP